MNALTMDTAKQPLRVLKKMRRYHRKNRSQPLHHAAFRSLNNAIQTRQHKLFDVINKVAETRFARLMKALAKRA